MRSSVAAAIAPNRRNARPSPSELPSWWKRERASPRHLGTACEVGDPVREMSASEQRFGAQRRFGLGGGDQSGEPLQAFRRPASQPVVGEQRRDVEPANRRTAVGLGCADSPNTARTCGMSLSKLAERVRAVRRGEPWDDARHPLEHGVDVAQPRRGHLVGRCAFQRVDGNGAQDLAPCGAHRRCEPGEARVDEASDDLVEVGAEPGADDIGDEVGVRVGDHHGEGEQDLPFVGRQRRHARVQGQPETRPTSRRPARPTPQVGLDPRGELANADQVEVTGDELEPSGSRSTARRGGPRVFILWPHREARVHQPRPVREQDQCVVRRRAGRPG